MGDPVATAQETNTKKFVYLTEHENAFVTVVTQHGRVSGVRLWALPTAAPKTADPFGIALNQDADVLTQKRGKPSRTSTDADGPFDAYQSGDVLWLYHLNGNQTIHTITVSTTQSAIEDLSDQALPALHSGTSPADAIVMDASKGDDAKRWEGMFLAVHPCQSSGSWREQKRQSVTADGASYDAVTVSCSSGGSTQTLYFRSARSFAPNAP
jgi:hypothetical protein